MKYSVKEIFYSLQGEGARTGRPAVFCRFSGCNLWSGLEADRAAADCQFCDTEFRGTDGTGGGKFRTAEALVMAVSAKWPKTGWRGSQRYVVCTGGEPLLQLDDALIDAFHTRDFEVAVETNGTILAPSGLDWICVSPKAAVLLALRCGDELKLVFPQVEPEAQPERFVDLDFRHFFLQPMDGPQRDANTRKALEYCLANPQWRLSLQTHKLLHIR